VPEHLLYKRTYQLINYRIRLSACPFEDTKYELESSISRFIGLP